MTLPVSKQRAVIERQGGRCASGAECQLAQDGQGADLFTLQRLSKSAIWRQGANLPPGRQAAVEFDHITPKSDAVRMDGVPCVFRDGVWMHVHDARNFQAVCAWCHDAKTQGERPGYALATPSVFAQGLYAKPKPERTGPRHGPTGVAALIVTPRRLGKSLRLRGKVPIKRYGT